MQNQRWRENLEGFRGKRSFIYRKTKIKITAGFSSETMKAGKHWSNIFEVLKEKIAT